MTTDAVAVKEFYSELFGWETVDNPIPDGGAYTMCSIGGRDVCGLSEMSPEMKASGMRTVRVHGDPERWRTQRQHDRDQRTVGRRASILVGLLRRGRL